MADIRALRLAIAEKLNHRRELIGQNNRLRSDLNGARHERDVALTAMKSGVMNFALEDCADQIVNAILDAALKASEVVAEQTASDGDYIIGIDIPSLHIRHRVARMDVNLGTEFNPSNRVAVKHLDLKVNPFASRERQLG